MPSSVRHDWSSINRGGAVDVVFVPAPRAASLAVAVYGSSNASFVLSVMPFVQEVRGGVFWVILLWVVRRMAPMLC